MKTEVERGVLKIDLHELVNALDDKARAELAKQLVADEVLFAAVLECVANDGHYFRDDEEGEWWFNGDTLAKLREKLLPLMPENHRELVRHLMRDVASARKEEERWRNWAWSMYHAWPQHEWRSRPEDPKFTHTPRPSDEAVDKVIAEGVP